MENTDKKPARKKEKRDYSQQRGSYRPDISRTLPHAIGSEKGVLGSMLLSPDEVIPAVLEKCPDSSVMHIPAHATVFDQIVTIFAAKKPVDFITLTQALKDAGTLDQVGGPGFVTDLFTFVPTAANVDLYLETVVEKHVRRRLIAAHTNGVGEAYDETAEVSGVLDSAQAAMIEIAQDTQRGDAVRHVKEGVMQAVEDIARAHSHRGRVGGLETGFHDFDRITDGMHPGQRIVIAGRPSMGKSAWADNVLTHVAVNLGKPVLKFSLEVSYEMSARRLLCGEAPLNLQRVRDGMLADADFPRLTAAAGRIAAAPIFIDDTAGLRTTEFKARARRAWQRHRIALIVIDYVQLMKSVTKRGQENRQLEISEIMQAVTETGRELRVPVLILAQLNRSVEERRDKIPMLSDLRESGSLEQDADVVGLLHRPEYYEKDEAALEELKGKATLIIAKNKDGPVKDIQLKFVKEYTRFENVTGKLFSNNQQERQQ